MRHVGLTTVIVVLALNLVNGADINHTFTFKDSDFEILKVNGYDQINSYGYSPYNIDGDIGSPQVLYRLFNFIIPPDQGVLEVTINEIKFEIFDGNIELFPIQAQAYYYGYETDWTEPDTNYYNSDKRYPELPVRLHNFGYYDGANHIATIEVMPVFYIALYKELYFCSEINITIRIGGSPIEEPLIPQIRMRQDQKISDRILYNSILNPSDIINWGYTPQLADTDIAIIPPAEIVVYPFVVITRDSLIGYWNEYVDWLNRKGIRAGVVSIETVIGYNFNDQNIDDDAGKLRGYLREALPLGTKWVLLGGISNAAEHVSIEDSTTIVPVRYSPGNTYTNEVLLQCDSVENWQTVWALADVYFSELSAPWDVDGDGHPGELWPISAGGDYLNYYLSGGEELFLGRLPVVDGQDILNWTDKIMNYEQNPGNGDNQYLLLSSCSLADQFQQQNQFDTNRAHYPNSFAYDVLYERDLNGPCWDNCNVIAPKGNDIISSMNDYPGFINWFHHGFPSFTGVAADHLAISYEEAKWIIAAHTVQARQCKNGDNNCSLESLENYDKPGFLFSVDCNEADFACPFSLDQSKRSLGAQYVLMENRGGVGFVGTSRYSPLVSSSWNAAIPKNVFLDGIFDSTFAIGQAKQWMNNQYPIAGLMINWTILGTPEQEVWSETPKHMTAIPDYTRDCVRVFDNGVPLVGAQVCFSSIDYSRWCVDTTDEEGLANIRTGYLFDVTNQTYITITKHNYIPYQIIGACSITTNQTWRGDIAIYGNLTIPSGTTLTIKPGTSIKLQNSQITINGQLIASGSYKYHISFNWPSGISPVSRGLVTGVSGSTKLQYCDLFYAKDAITAIGSNSIYIDNCLITNSQTSGISCVQTKTVKIQNSRFTDNNLYAIHVALAQDSAVILNNIIEGYHIDGIRYFGNNPQVGAIPLFSGNKLTGAQPSSISGIFISNYSPNDYVQCTIFNDSITNFNIGIETYGLATGSSIGPRVLCNNNSKYGIALNWSNVDIFGNPDQNQINSFSFNGYDGIYSNSNVGSVRWSKIEGNFWAGCESWGDAFNFGNEYPDEGNNSFADVLGGGDDGEYFIVNDGPTLTAKNNWWGTTEEELILQRIVNVNYAPYLVNRPFQKTGLLTRNIPMTLDLSSSYPNPFNLQAKIDYAIPATTRVSLKIYNILGQEINELINQEIQPGYYSIIWNGIDKSGRQVSSGVYLYSLKTPDKVITKKMVMLK